MAAAVALFDFAAQKRVIFDLSPFVKLYDDNTHERLIPSPYVPPLARDPVTGVSSKDTATAPPTRIFLPQLTSPTQKLPIIVHFHAGGFCVGSAFSQADLKYLNLLASEANALVISVEYRLAPEHRLPTAYEDSWAALNWVCSHVLDRNHFVKDPWIANHGDFSKLFVVGDSAGGNIAHNTVMRACSVPLPGDLKIRGLVVNHPYFWGSVPVGEEFEAELEQTLGYRTWKLAYPDAAGGIDSPMINPIADGAPCLSRLACSKLMVTVAEIDELTPRAVAYARRVEMSGWKGAVEILEVAGESHCFHIMNPESEKARFLIQRMSSFINFC